MDAIMMLESTVAAVLSLGGVAGPLLTAARSAHAQTTAVHSDRGMSARIEMDRATHKLGQPIAVRLTMQNASGHKLNYVYGEAPSFADLVILDANGRQVKMTLQPAGQISSGPLQWS